MKSWQITGVGYLPVFVTAELPYGYPVYEFPDVFYYMYIKVR